MLRRVVRPGPTAIAAVVGLLFGIAARLPYLLDSDFPLNDGGMFLAMSQDVFNAHFALPKFASYNFAGIPFAYPPLPFYLVAAIHGITGIDFLTLLRVVPLLANLGTIIAVGLLARSLLGSGWAAWVAPSVFAVLPRGYEWMIMGGGLTRSLGFMFVILCLTSARELFRRPDVWRLLGTGLLAAAAISSHLEMAVFLVYSIGAMAILSAKSPKAILLAAAVLILAVVYTVPWWGTVLMRFGMEPFDAASLTSYWSSITDSLNAFQDFTFQPGVVFGTLGVIALLGAIACILQGEFFVPFWLPAVFVWVPRSAQSEASLPLALLVGVGLVDVVVPGLRSVLDRTSPPILRRAGVLSIVHQPLPILSHAARFTEAAGVALMMIAVFVYSPKTHYDPTVLDSLSDGDRQAMAWVSQNTPADARFLVVSTSRGWEEDSVGEWFPVLAQRRSVLTPQGTEWLPDQTFARTQCTFYSVRALSSQGKDVDYTDEWARERGVAYSYIYVSKHVRGPVDWTKLLQSAESSPNYGVVYESPGAVIFARQQPLEPFWSPDGQLIVSRDCQSLADQPQPVQQSYLSTYGYAAAWEWVRQRDAQVQPPASLCTKLEDVGVGQVGVVRSVCRADDLLATQGTKNLGHP